MDYGKMAVDLHRKTRGKISMHSKVPLESVLDMSPRLHPWRRPGEPGRGRRQGSGL